MSSANGDIKKKTEIKTSLQFVDHGAIQSHDPYDPSTAVFCHIWHVRYGFGPYNVRPYQATILGLTVRLRHPYKPGRTAVLYGTAGSPNWLTRFLEKPPVD